MVSSTVNVVRYSALLAGVFYGIVHRRTLQEKEDRNKEKRADQRRIELFKQTQEAWRNKQDVGKKSGVITNPDDPKFDLEKLLATWEKNTT